MDNPIIHNWVAMHFSHGTSIYGQIYNDDRWPNGTGIKTSACVSLDREAGELKTRNTLYTLGKEYEKE